MATFSDVEIVNPLHQIEAVLGNIETWPSNIIKLIFIDDYITENVFRTGAFFYRNKVSLNVALAFYSLCNEHNPLLTLLHFGLMYKMWNTHTCCTCTYYDIKQKKIMRINREQSEKEEVGIDGTGHSASIRARLALMFI